MYPQSPPPLHGVVELGRWVWFMSGPCAILPRSSGDCLLASGTVPVCHNIPAQTAAMHNDPQATKENIPKSSTHHYTKTANWILNKWEIFTLPHVVSVNVNKFDILSYKMNCAFIAVFLVVEMLKNIDFQGSYVIFYQTKV